MKLWACLWLRLRLRMRYDGDELEICSRTPGKSILKPVIGHFHHPMLPLDKTVFYSVSSHMHSLLSLCVKMHHYYKNAKAFMEDGKGAYSILYSNFLLFLVDFKDRVKYLDFLRKSNDPTNLKVLIWGQFFSFHFLRV